MSKFVVIIFPNETKAYEGTVALKELHGEGSIVLYSTAVLSKNDEGTISVREAATGGPLGTAVGALVGGLVGLLGGPVGVAVGLTGGALVGAAGDLFNTGISTAFVKTISDELSPGKTAVIAEIQEDWVTPLNTRMEEIGGTIIRTPRSDIEDEQIEKEVAARKAEFERIRAEYAQAADEARTRLKKSLDAAKQDLEEASERARTRAEGLKKEAAAKVDALEKQAKQAAADAEARIRTTIASLQTEYDRRTAKLNKAWDLAKDALS